MTVALVAFALLELVLIGWGVAQRRGVSRFTKRRIVLNTVSGTAIEGVLKATYPDCFVIGSPRYLNAAQPEHVPGEIVVERSQTDCFQVKP